jgi:hypothetical protein
MRVSQNTPATPPDLAPSAPQPTQSLSHLLVGRVAVEKRGIDPMPTGPWWWGILDVYHTLDSALSSFEHD